MYHSANRHLGNLELLGQIAALEDADAGNSAAGNVTYMQQKRRGYVVDETAFRVLRFKEIK